MIECEEGRGREGINVRKLVRRDGKKRDCEDVRRVVKRKDKRWVRKRDCNERRINRK